MDVRSGRIQIDSRQVNRLMGVHVTPTVLFNVSIVLGDRKMLRKADVW